MVFSSTGTIGQTICRHVRVCRARVAWEVGSGREKEGYGTVTYNGLERGFMIDDRVLAVLCSG